MNNSNICIEVLNRIDNADSGGMIKIKEDYKDHLEACQACRSYYGTSLNLQDYAAGMEEIELWPQFAAMERRKINHPAVWPAVSSRIAGAFAAFLLVCGIFAGINSGIKTQTNIYELTNNVGSNVLLNENNKSNNSQEEYIYESSDLDYYYEISQQI